MADYDSSFVLWHAVLGCFIVVQKSHKSQRQVEYKWLELYDGTHQIGQKTPGLDQCHMSHPLFSLHPPFLLFATPCGSPLSNVLQKPAKIALSQSVQKMPAQNYLIGIDIFLAAFLHPLERLIRAWSIQTQMCIGWIPQGAGDRCNTLQRHLAPNYHLQTDDSGIAN